MRFWADENFRGDVLRGLRAAFPELIIMRVQDNELSGAPDDRLLAEAAIQGAILLTHDVQTLTNYAYERVRAGLSMPGVIEVTQDAPIGQILIDLEVLIGAGSAADFENLIWYVPLH